MTRCWDGGEIYRCESLIKRAEDKRGFQQVNLLTAYVWLHNSISRCTHPAVGFMPGPMVSYLVHPEFALSIKLYWRTTTKSDLVSGVFKLYIETKGTRTLLIVMTFSHCATFFYYYHFIIFIMDSKWFFDSTYLISQLTSVNKVLRRLPVPWQACGEFFLHVQYSKADWTK